MECATCGLASGDLPDDIDADEAFTHGDGEDRCWPCATGRSLTIITRQEPTE